MSAILLVESNRVVRDDLAQMLRDKGYAKQVLSASNAEEAIRRYAHVPKLVAAFVHMSFDNLSQSGLASFVQRRGGRMIWLRSSAMLPDDAPEDWTIVDIPFSERDIEAIFDAGA